MTHAKDKELKQWRSTIATEVKLAADRSHTLLSSGGYVVAATFMLPRPQYHFRKTAGKSGPDIKPQFQLAQHRVKPDLDKLIRAVLDALTGIIWTDDSCVIGFTELMKSYGTLPGMFLTIGHIGDPNVTQEGLFV